MAPRAGGDVSSRMDLGLLGRAAAAATATVDKSARRHILPAEGGILAGRKAPARSALYRIAHQVQ